MKFIFSKNFFSIIFNKTNIILPRNCKGIIIRKNLKLINCKMIYGNLMITNLRLDSKLKTSIIIKGTNFLFNQFVFFLNFHLLS